MTTATTTTTATTPAGLRQEPSFAVAGEDAPWLLGDMADVRTMNDIDNTMSMNGMLDVNDMRGWSSLDALYVDPHQHWVVPLA